MAWRSDTMPRLEAHARPYCPTNPASPRTVNRPITTAGISHNGSAPC